MTEFGSFALAPEDGTVAFREPLAAHTTLRIGGPAEVFVEVFREAGLVATLARARESGRRVFLLGKGSNILVDDAGIAGFVVVLSGEFREIRIDGERLVAGGGAALGGVCAAASRAGLSGIEAISGIPSSVGGAVRINAGAYGGEIFDVVESLRLASPEGIAVRAAEEIRHGYRWTSLVDSREIVTRATLRLRRAPRAEIDRRTREVAEKRRGALPSEPNAGSIFKNPEGTFAGKLIEECGLKGLRAGGAEISTRHANVIVNRGGATASDVRELMGRMRTLVLERFGVELVPEIDLVGAPWP